MASKSVAKGIKGKRLLVVNTGNRKKRFTLKRLRDLGCNLIILNATENWGSAYASHWILADTNDHTASLRAVKDFFAQHPELGPDGVITFWEDDVLLAARIRDRLGLIGIPYEVARLARDKHLFRAFCHEHGLPAPGHALIPEDADPAGIRPDDVHQDADQGGLACAVGAEEAEDLAFANLQGDAAQGDRVPVALVDIVEGQQAHPIVPRSVGRGPGGGPAVTHGSGIIAENRTRAPRHRVH